MITISYISFTILRGVILKLKREKIREYDYITWLISSLKLKQMRLRAATD